MGVCNRARFLDNGRRLELRTVGSKNYLERTPVPLLGSLLIGQTRLSDGNETRGRHRHYHIESRSKIFCARGKIPCTLITWNCPMQDNCEKSVSHHVCICRLGDDCLLDFFISRTSLMEILWMLLMANLMYFLLHQFHRCTLTRVKTYIAIDVLANILMEYV